MSALVAALDSALAANSEEVKLRRPAGTDNQIFVEVTFRAAVDLQSNKDLVSGNAQDEFHCIFSPTEINRQQWPGGQLPGGTEDPRIPSKNKGDEAYIQGDWRAVQRGKGFYPEGLVRIEMWAVG